MNKDERENVFIIVTIVVLLLSIFGNILVILTILCQRSLKGIYHLLVLHLALCDLLFSLTHLFVVLFFGQVLRISFDVFVSLSAIRDVAMLAQYFIVIIIVVLRYRAVAKPFATSISRKKLFCLIALIYALPFLVNGTHYLNRRFELFPPIEPVIGAYIDFSCATITTLVMIVLYGRMCYLLHVHNKRMKYSNNEENNANKCHLVARQKRNRKIIVTSVVVVVFFLVSQLQRNVFRLLSTFGFLPRSLSLIFAWPSVLHHFGTCTVNPFIYAFSDRAILEGYKKTLRKCMKFFLQLRKRQIPVDAEPENVPNNYPLQNIQRNNQENV